MRTTSALFCSFMVAAVTASGCAGGSTRPESATIGPNPTLAAPQKALIPDINVVEAVGWSGTATPLPADGMRVSALAPATSR